MKVAPRLHARDCRCRTCSPAADHCRPFFALGLLAGLLLLSAVTVATGNPSIAQLTYASE